jgi:hypothetical protein
MQSFISVRIFGNAVDAINNLYAVLGSPDLDGWTTMVTKDRLVVWRFLLCKLLVIFAGNLLCDVN